MKRTLIGAALAAAAVLAVPAVAQMGGWGYGPGYGMMRGYGPGYGMMGGYGPGYGMMRGYGPGYGYGASLTPEQREKVAAIRSELRQTQWALMQSMHAIDWQQPGASEAADTLHKQMFENSLEARKRIDAVVSGGE